MLGGAADPFRERDDAYHGGEEHPWRRRVHEMLEHERQRNEQQQDVQHVGGRLCQYRQLRTSAPAGAVMSMRSTAQGITICG